MIILLELSIIAAFVLMAIYMLRRPVEADVQTPDQIASLNKRVRALEQIVNEKGLGQGRDTGGPA